MTTRKRKKQPDEFNQEEEQLSPLKALRLEAGLTQNELARQIPDKTGVKKLSQRAVSGWESGEYQPEMTLEQIAALCRAFSISFKTLCRRQGIDVTGVPDDIPPKRSPSSSNGE